MAVRELSPACLAVVQAVRPWLEVAADERRGVVLGVSGGADSMALAAAVAHLCSVEPVETTSSTWSVTPRVVIVDHALQSGSADVSAHVSARVHAMGLPASVVRVAVDLESGRGLEAAARDARLQALSQADPEALVMVAHTLDDQAETVLLGLGRGSGNRSLAGMAARSGRWIRPLLGLRRATTEQACRDWCIEIWDDPHNREARFRRVRVRHELLPLMDDVLGGGVAEALARTAELARDDADALDALAAEQVGCRHNAEGALPVEGLADLPSAVLSRVIRQWLHGRGVGRVDHAHTQAVLALVVAWRGQGPVHIPGAQVVRSGGFLRLEGR